MPAAGATGQVLPEIDVISKTGEVGGDVFGLILWLYFNKENRA